MSIKTLICMTWPKQDVITFSHTFFRCWTTFLWTPPYHTPWFLFVTFTLTKVKHTPIKHRLIFLGRGMGRSRTSFVKSFVHLLIFQVKISDNITMLFRHYVSRNSFCFYFVILSICFLNIQILLQNTGFMLPELLLTLCHWSDEWRKNLIPFLIFYCITFFTDYKEDCISLHGKAKLRLSIANPCRDDFDTKKSYGLYVFEDDLTISYSRRC